MGGEQILKPTNAPDTATAFITKTGIEPDRFVPLPPSISDQVSTACRRLRPVQPGLERSRIQGPARVVGGRGLPFDEEAKLVYGVVLSLRNMVKKLSGRDEAFTSYRTSNYKLHLYETLTGYRFVLLSDPSADSLRFVLRQLYTGPFIDHVVRNSLVEMDSRTEGIDNDQFRAAVDRHMRGLSMFGT
ncbi:MAG: TRAPP subunit bet5 [Tremellales sp. Tagirdzhanova-0007]|nr:MAG: TRAPP subunit bet5 [Tremellales sp. Tagirdzhanova-0007]